MNPRPAITALRLVALAWLSIVCCGCTAPSREVLEMHPRVITPAQSHFLQDGVTTPRQVLLALGEPDYWWAGQLVFAYLWPTRGDSRTPFPGLEYVSAGHEDEHDLLMEFDDSGRLRRHERTVATSAHWFTLEELRAHWRPGGGGK